MSEQKHELLELEERFMVVERLLLCLSNKLCKTDLNYFVKSESCYTQLS